MLVLKKSELDLLLGPVGATLCKLRDVAGLRTGHGLPYIEAEDGGELPHVDFVRSRKALVEMLSSLAGDKIEVVPE